jgi:transcriptional regulator of acetoin/glycerol metabolism
VEDNLELDTSTVPAGGTRGSLDRDAVSAIYWVFPKLKRPIPLIESRMFVGRGENCQIQLEGRSVSRRHVEIYRQGPIFALRDLSSTNGTCLNGQRVQHSAVSHGDVLRVGDHVGIVGTVPTRADSVDFSELAPGLFGSGRLAKPLDVARRAATSGLSVVLLGETGVGKELVAQAIHAWSGRPGPCCAVNCATLPTESAERELFGDPEAGAEPTVGAHLGYFRQADRGTLLLDEVSELPIGVQAKLLRVLEEGIVVPVGQSRGIPIDVRMIATSQQGLADLVAQRTFRNDFFARLSGTTISLPPLRARREDIVPLFELFFARCAGALAPPCTAEFIESLCLHAWPCNLRELKHVARQLYALHGDVSRLERSMLPEAVRGQRPVSEPPPVGASTTDRREHDLLLLVAALKRSHGNVKAASAALGFSRQRAYRIMNGRSASKLMSLETVEPSGTDGESSSHPHDATSGGPT